MLSIFHYLESMQKRNFPSTLISLSAGLLHLASLLMNVLAQATALSCILLSAEVFDAMLITMTSEEFLP